MINCSKPNQSQIREIEKGEEAADLAYKRRKKSILLKAHHHNHRELLSSS